MRIPGIKQIYHVQSALLPRHIELMQDATSVLIGIQQSLVPIRIIGSAQMDVNESYPGNSYCQEVKVTFITAHRHDVPHGSCIVVEFVDGSMLLVGTPEHRPTIVSRDTIATPGSSSTSVAWTVELTSKKAAISIKASTLVDEHGEEITVLGSVTEITEDEIDTMLANIS